MYRLLYIAPFCNIPPADGGSQRGINLLLQLARQHQVTLLTYRQQSDLEALQAWATGHNIAARWLSATPVYHRRGTFWGRLFAARPPGFATHDPQGIANDIDRIWAEEGPFDILYFATHLMGQTILKKRWPARLVIDLYDAYTPIARAKARQVSPWRPYHWLFRLEAIRVRATEARMLKSFDLAVVISKEDARVVTTLSPATPVAVIPNGVNLPSVSSIDSNQAVILMVANYHYPPNAEGVNWFYEHVWPILCQTQPEIRLCLVGSHSQALSTLTQADHRVEWVGPAPDLAPYYQPAACVIVPILSGSGTRLKLLEAMAWGVPAVSTSLGAQGIEHAGSVAIADTPAQFAEAILQCLTLPNMVTSRATKARQVIAAHYTWDSIGGRLRAEMDKLLTNSEYEAVN